MFTHMTVGTNDMARARIFYDALFGALGAGPGFTDDKGRAVYARNGAFFIVTTPIDGAPATHANGGTIGFAMDGPDQVDAWHAAGAAAGGTPIEDAPGVREGGAGRLYLAYLRDPDGNKLCAMHPMSA